MSPHDLHPGRERIYSAIYMKDLDWSAAICCDFKLLVLLHAHDPPCACPYSWYALQLNVHLSVNFRIGTTCCRPFTRRFIAGKPSSLVKLGYQLRGSLVVKRVELPGIEPGAIACEAIVLLFLGKPSV